MKLHTVFAVASATLAAAVSCAALAAAPAQTIADKIGEQSVTLPVLPGLTEPDGAVATVRDMLVRALPANYRLIALQVQQDYLDKVHAHDPSASMQRYCLVLTYRNYEANGMSPELFAGIKKMIREQSAQVMKMAEAQAASGIEHMNFYSDYRSKDDLVWAEDQAREWIRRANELNP